MVHEKLIKKVLKKIVVKHLRTCIKALQTAKFTTRVLDVYE